MHANTVTTRQASAADRGNVSEEIIPDEHDEQAERDARTERIDKITVSLEKCQDAIHGAGELALESLGGDHKIAHAIYSILELAEVGIERAREELAEVQQI
jgi:arginase family enzyme